MHLDYRWMHSARPDGVYETKLQVHTVPVRQPSSLQNRRVSIPCNNQELKMSHGIHI